MLCRRTLDECDVFLLTRNRARVWNPCANRFTRRNGIRLDRNGLRNAHSTRRDRGLATRNGLREHFLMMWTGLLERTVVEGNRIRSTCTRLSAQSEKIRRRAAEIEFPAI